MGGAGQREPGEGRRAQAVSGQQGAPKLFSKLGGHSGETRDSGKGRDVSESGGRIARTKDHSSQGNAHSDWPGLLFPKSLPGGVGLGTRVRLLPYPYGVPRRCFAPASVPVHLGFRWPVFIIRTLGSQQKSPARTLKKSSDHEVRCRDRCHQASWCGPYLALAEQQRADYLARKS